MTRLNFAYNYCLYASLVIGVLSVIGGIGMFVLIVSIIITTPNLGLGAIAIMVLGVMAAFIFGLGSLWLLGCRLFRKNVQTGRIILIVLSLISVVVDLIILLGQMSLPNDPLLLTLL